MRNGLQAVHEVFSQKDSFILFLVTCHVVVNAFNDGYVCWVQRLCLRKSEDGDKFVTEYFDIDCGQCGYWSIE